MPTLAELVLHPLNGSAQWRVRTLRNEGKPITAAAQSRDRLTFACGQTRSGVLMEVGRHDANRLGRDIDLAQEAAESTNQCDH